MKIQEELMGSKEYTQLIKFKGKRTKRHRASSPLALTMTSTSCSTAEGGGGSGSRGSSGGGGDNSSEFYSITTSPTNSITKTTQVEEDMANCLILLAQGQTQKSSDPIYQCKTCNRCFQSFQALGGHRASHKRPKATVEEKNPVAAEYHDGTTLSLLMPNRALFNSTNNNKSKVHECSICGAEFTSGQALGGHMRRHRAMAMATSSTDHESQEVKKLPKNLLSLDLNLPAPDDDQPEAKFHFGSKEQVIVFSASPLVDCHY